MKNKESADEFVEISQEQLTEATGGTRQVRRVREDLKGRAQWWASRHGSVGSRSNWGNLHYDPFNRREGRG